MRKEKVFSQNEALALAQRNENQQKTIMELKEKCAALTTSGEEMGREINLLKETIGGYRTSNANYRRRIDALKEKVEHLTVLDREGDELNEKRIAEIDSLKVMLCSKDKTIEVKDKVIAGLESQVRGLNETIKEQADRIVELKGDAAADEANLEYYKSLPWYKRFFRN